MPRKMLALLTIALLLPGAVCALAQEEKKETSDAAVKAPKIPAEALARSKAGALQPQKAVCVLMPTTGSETQGVVTFSEMADGKMVVKAVVTGLKADAKHAIHVHEFGDVTDLSGKSAGGHFNPTNKPHGLPPAKERHAGDLGNLEADANGKAEYEITVDNITIEGAQGILGRAVVIHADPDDGGQPTGNAGARIAFGVIGLAKPAE